MSTRTTHARVVCCYHGSSINGVAFVVVMVMVCVVVIVVGGVELVSCSRCWMCSGRRKGRFFLKKSRYRSFYCASLSLPSRTIMLWNHFSMTALPLLLRCHYPRYYDMTNLFYYGITQEVAKAISTAIASKQYGYEGFLSKLITQVYTTHI